MQPTATTLTPTGWSLNGPLARDAKASRASANVNMGHVLARGPATN
jgi:hypothetical protein